jgi:hypothetical protein
MARLAISKFGDNLPVTAMVAVAQAVAGAGLGLLLADRVGSRSRDKIGMALLIGGLAAMLPAAVGIATNLGDRPNSSHRVRRRIESIRLDTGMSENGEQF